MLQNHVNMKLSATDKNNVSNVREIIASVGRYMILPKLLAYHYRDVNYVPQTRRVGDILFLVRPPLSSEQFDGF